MALAGLTEAKRYLRLQTTADDTLVTALVASALALIEGWIGRPVTAVSRTFTDEARTSMGVLSVCALLVPTTPLGTVTAITDADGTAVDLSALRVVSDTGAIVAKDGSPFTNGPYTITASVGLSIRADYATVVEPIINQAILDVVADLYQRRNPAAAREAEGGGIAVDYVRQTRGVGADNAREDLLPERTAAILAPLRMVQV